MFIFDDSEVCADNLSDTGRREKQEERSAGRSRECSTSSSKSHFVPKIDFFGRFETIIIKPNEMFKNFNSTFVKIDDDVLESDSSPLKLVNRAQSTITKEAGSKLNPNCEPYVPTGSLEQGSTSTSLGPDQASYSSRQTIDNPLFSDHIPECVDNGAEASETAPVDNISSSSEDQLTDISDLLDNLAV
ncbi:hypothetical protein R6Q57_021338 [Mikania cordata]